MSIYLDLKNSKDYIKLQEASNIIKAGGIVLFPTETVYGIGADCFNEQAVKKVFQAKGRDFHNPINLLVSSIDMVNMVAKNISDLEYSLMKAFFPGPFTLILSKKDTIPSIVTAGQSTVGVRMPDNEIALKLVEYSGVPLATPSANLSGKPSGTLFQNVYDDFNDKVDCLIDGGNSSIGIESTIVKVIDNVPHILRPGAITAEQIRAAAGNVINDFSASPSDSLKHYSLNSKSILVYSSNNALMISKIIEIASNYKNPIIISQSKNIDNYKNFHFIDIGNDMNSIAHNIFKALKEADTYNSDIIIIEGIEQQGLGTAIMNRLIKACDNNFIVVS